jgi:membrane protein
LAQGVSKSPKVTFRMLGQLLKETGTSWIAHKAPRMGAALSYYTAFSLAPLLVLCFSIFSLIYTQRAEAVSHFFDQLGNVLPAKAVTAMEGILNHAASPHAASWATALSTVILFFSASSAFGELQDALNEIWEVPPQKRPFVSMVKQRSLSFAMVLILGFFMLVSLMLSTMLTAVDNMLLAHVPVIGVAALTTNLASFVLFVGLFATIYRILPDVALKWRDVLPGALFSTILFLLGKAILGWYIGTSSTFSAYGAAGSFVIILLWVYYSAQILYLGAEFTRAYTKRYGSLHKPRS